MDLLQELIGGLIERNNEISKIIDIQKLTQEPNFIVESTNSYLYIGQMVNGVKNGTGIQKMIDSHRMYIGEWQNDRKCGLAYEKFQSGAEYIGNYMNSKQNGYGKYMWANGEIYQGNWSEGKKSGYGEWVGIGSTYKGEWNNGYVEGKGVYQSENGDQYTGDFLKSMKHGLGEEIFANGDKYVGCFRNGKPDGYGEYFWKNGSVYKGCFFEGMRHGQGLWQSNIQGVYDKYEGAYQNDKKQGYGEFTWSNGSLYKGNYFDDYRQGFGEMYQDGKLIYSGEWDQGVRVSGGPNSRFKFQQKFQTLRKLKEQKNLNFEEIKELDEEALTSGVEKQKIIEKQQNMFQYRKIKTEAEEKIKKKNLQSNELSPMKKSLQLRRNTIDLERSRMSSVNNQKDRVSYIVRKRSNSNQVNQKQKKVDQTQISSPYQQVMRSVRFKLQKLQTMNCI